MKYLVTLFIFYFATFYIFGQAAPKISPDSIAKHVYYLASDELQGRNTGSPGQKLAADYIANYFRQFGLKPAGNSEKNPYFQEFFLYSHNVYHKFPAYQNLSEFNHSQSGSGFLYFGTKDQPNKWLNETICSFSEHCCGNTDVFRFFGANDLKAMTDSVRLLYERCSNRKFLSLLPDDVFSFLSQGEPNWNSMIYRINDRFRFIPPPNSDDIPGDIAFEFINDFVSEMGNIELILVNQRYLNERGYFPDPATRLDSVPFTIYKAQVHDSIHTENVAGYIEAPGNRNRCIVIGAHYDHIGFNNKGIYNGADDNASGTAALIELARLFSQPAVRNSLNTNILIIAFSAEEKGLLGSQLYTVFPYFPLDSTIVMLNMDMIGRLNLKPNGKGQVLFLSFGNEKKQLNKTVRKAAASDKFIRVYTHPGLVNRIGYKRGSDHYNFFTNGVTSGVFFTGLHEDYHKTTDTAEKISYRNMAEIIRLVYLTALKYDKNTVVKFPK